ncbi:MAG: hypothetical protein HYU52_00110 [Acidobacteria bacterium]|nr:hypothetical protein [Acidobacteriota bacterium]
METTPKRPDDSLAVEGEDFYREGPYMVFTEAYLRRRGYCCESGCRHCPWKGEASPGSSVLSPQS